MMLVAQGWIWIIGSFGHLFGRNFKI